jgi:hypothetical protein
MEWNKRTQGIFLGVFIMCLGAGLWVFTKDTLAVAIITFGAGFSTSVWRN